MRIATRLHLQRDNEYLQSMQTANDGAYAQVASATPKERETSADKARDDLGRFREGNRFSRGRPRSSFSREARRQADMPSLVRRLIDLIECDRTNPREVLQAMQLLISYTEGKPLARSMSVHATVPQGFDLMTPHERERLLEIDDVLALPGGDDDE